MTVLIVDDIADNRLAIALLLEDIEDVNIIEASNGEEAVNICKSASVDLVLMDVMMPVMDGIEATRQISAMPRKPMIVAVSALDDNRKKNEMLSAGAQDYLTKPINAELFMARVRNYNKILASMHERDLKNEWAINPFSQKVFAKKVLFRITNEASLGELWEDFLIGNKSVNDAMSDCIRAVYSAGIALLKSHMIFDVIVEESEESYFFTFTKIEGYNKQFISKLILKNFRNAKTRYGSVAFSLVLPKADKADVTPLSETLLPVVAPSITATTQEIKTPTRKLDTEEEKLLRTSFDHKINAMHFVSELEESFFDKIDILVEKEDELDAQLFDLETSGKLAYVYQIGANLQEYASIIESLHEFKNISFAICKLANFLEGLSVDAFGQKQQNKLTILIKGLLSDMTEWRKKIFYERSALDIHYLDSSLISSCIQIENIFANEPLIENDDDLELF